MPRFKFRLEPLLSLRESVRDDRRELLADVLRVEQRIDGELDELGRMMTDIRRRQTPGVGAVDVDRLLDAGRYEALLVLEQMRLNQQKTAVAAEVETRRRALAEAEVEVRVMEKLKEKLRDRHRQDDERQDMKRLDEVAARTAHDEERDP